jgi:hypothetical protein
MSITTATRSEQTPAQWAVRWHGLVLFAAVLLAVPLAHATWHWLLGNDAPWLRTRSQLPAPEPTWHAVMHASPSWMDQKEKQLREDSPVTWWLRGTWNELRYRAGVPLSQRVHFGADEWFFVMDSVSPDRGALERAAPARRRFFAEVRDLVQQAGAELFVTVIPDKARKCYADGVLPPNKRDNYTMLLADLEAAGVATVDVAAALAAARAADPATELWFRRDTHWRPAGAMVVGRTVAAAIEQRFGERLGPRVTLGLAGITSIRLMGDLPANMGICTVELPDPVIEWRTAPMSFLAERLTEVRDYVGLEVRGATTVAMDGRDPAAPVLQLGASATQENGMVALSFFLGRPVRAIVRRGAVGIEPVRAALPELRGGTRAKVVVWDLVERGFSAPEWQDPKL